MKKFTDKQCLKAGLDVISRMAERDRKKRQERIEGWSKPDLVVEDQENKVKIGLYKYDGGAGVLKIEANARGEFDPYMGTFFTRELIEALYNCLMEK